jgi:hypothetical protein
VQPYQDRGVQDKERYKLELRQYLELRKPQNGKIPTGLAISEHDVEDAIEKLKEAVVDAAVNNAVDVSVDDVDVATKTATDATVGLNHSLASAAAASNVEAAYANTGKAAATDPPGVIAVVDATNRSCNPIAAVDADNGTPANTATVATVDPNITTDFDDGVPDAVSDEPDGSANFLASMDVEVELQQPESTPQQPEISQHPW